MASTRQVAEQSANSLREPATLQEVLTPKRLAALKELAAAYGVKDLRVFGSYARGEASSTSDLDLLVDIDYSPGVAKRFLAFCAQVEQLFGMKVDVLTQEALDSKLHARIFREARSL